MPKSKSIQQQLSQGGTLQKYRSTVIGNKGIKEFLLYEFTTTLICPLPGAFGIYARHIFMPLLFNHFGHKTTMNKDVTFRRPHKIHVGDRVILESGVILDVKTSAGFIEIHDDVHIGKNTILSCPGGTISIGKGTRIGENCRLGSLKGLAVGQYSMIDNFTCIVGAGHTFSSHNLPIIHQPLTCKGSTTIEDYVQIGKKVTVLDGVHIGKKTKILDNSLVNKNIPPNCSAWGIPASPHYQ